MAGMPQTSPWESFGDIRASALLVLLRCLSASVVAVTLARCSVGTFILHGCRAHAAPATWLRQPCRKTSLRAVPELLTRFPRPVMLYHAEHTKRHWTRCGILAVAGPRPRRAALHV